MSIPNVKMDTELPVNNVVIPVQEQLGNEESYLKLITKRFFKHKLAVVGLIIFSLI